MSVGNGKGVRGSIDTRISPRSGNESNFSSKPLVISAPGVTEHIVAETYLNSPNPYQFK